MGWGSAEVLGRWKHQRIASSVCACIGICADVCAHIPLLWGISRVFQLEWSHLVLFVHLTLLVCYGIGHVLFLFSLPLHLLFGLCVCACTHSHTVLADWLPWVQAMLLFPEAFFDLHQLGSHINPWAQPHCRFDFCLITVYFRVSSLLDWEPLEDRGCVLCISYLAKKLAALFFFLALRTIDIVYFLPVFSLKHQFHESNEERNFCFVYHCISRV